MQYPNINGPEITIPASQPITGIQFNRTMIEKYTADARIGSFQFPFNIPRA